MAIPILMYHQIDTPPARGSAMRGLVVAPASFARQMALLRLLGYRGLSMRELEPYLRGEQEGKVVGITFDDGFLNTLQNALPVLLKHGFTATCYGVSRMLGARNSWDQDLGIPQKPLMSAADWRTWSGAGMDVGSHTQNHVALTKIPLNEAATQITESKREMEATAHCEVRHFCYPFGWYGPEHRDMVIAAGYASATTTHRGRFHAGHDLYSLRRIMVARATHLGLFAAKVTTAYEDRRA